MTVRAPALARVFSVLFVTLLLASPVTTPSRAAESEKFGTVDFATSCSAAAQTPFKVGVALLHSFAFDAAIKWFTEAAQIDPGCAIAHWGVAVAWLGNPLAAPPSARGLKEGWAAVERAKAAGARTQRERDYVAAIETLYKDAEKVDHRTRAVAYEKAMEQLAQRYPDDREAAVFHALALNITLNPSDKTYAKQLQAAAILEKVFAEQPNHPGVAHYLIHSYDFPPIASKGLPAARRYASIAPAAPHAQHMPSHIFTRVGAWQESIDANRASAKVATAAVADNQYQFGLRSYEALHAYDYMMYAFLQLAKDRDAKALMEEVGATRKLNVDHFAGAFALAAIPARFRLERGQWAEAAALPVTPSDVPWDKFAQAESIIWFARGIGAARSGDIASARKDLERLDALRDTLTQAKNAYWAQQSEIQRRAVAAWIALADTKTEEAVTLMRSSADLEDSTEKHPVTPGSIKPARELLGEMLLQVAQPGQALKEFEASQRTDPDRFNGIYGAARAAELAGDREKARAYYGKLVSLAAQADTERPELKQAKAFLGK